LNIWNEKIRWLLSDRYKTYNTHKISKFHTLGDMFTIGSVT